MPLILNDAINQHPGSWNQRLVVRLPEFFNMGQRFPQQCFLIKNKHLREK
jgi:hypothetical protein